MESVISAWAPRDEVNKFVSSLDGDTLHEIGTRMQWDDTGAWFIAIARHPKCDHATLWTMYRLAAPEYYESRAREINNKRPEMSGMDRDFMDLLDIVVNRFEKGDIASRKFRTFEEHPFKKFEAQQRDILEKGTPLQWELPAAAFIPTEQQDHNPKYKVFYGDTIVPA